MEGATASGSGRRVPDTGRSAMSPEALGNLMVEL